MASDQPDEPVVRACLEGSATAWEALCDRVRRLTRWVATTYGWPLMDVDDVSQQVCQTLLEDGRRLLRTYDVGRASLSAFLIGIIRNAFRQHMRAQSGPHEVLTIPLDDVDELADERQAIALDRLSVWETASRELSAEDRHILRLYAAGFRSHEIAALLQTVYGVPFTASSVRKRKERVVNRLRKILAK